MAVKIEDDNDNDSEIEDNRINHVREQKVDDTELEAKESDVSNFKLILLDIIFPLFDVLVDILKGLLLIFQYESLSSFYRFENHFNENKICGLVAISLKWVPSIVALIAMI